MEAGGGRHPIYWAIYQVDLHTCHVFIWGPSFANTMARMVRNNITLRSIRTCRFQWHVDVQNTCESVVLLIIEPCANKKKLPIEGWLLFFTKTLFDREMSISENSVRPAHILQNSSLIMGKQIINILPEGYVYTLILICSEANLPQVPQQ